MISGIILKSAIFISTSIYCTTLDGSFGTSNFWYAISNPTDIQTRLGEFTYKMGLQSQYNFSTVLIILGTCILTYELIKPLIKNLIAKFVKK